MTGCRVCEALAMRACDVAPRGGRSSDRDAEAPQSPLEGRSGRCRVRRKSTRDGRVRHAIGRAARRAGLDAHIICELMGHGADETCFRVQPLPSVGSRRGDGRIRRVMLVAGEGVDAADWSDVLVRLLGVALAPEPARAPVAMLAPLAGRDPVVARFLGVARRWTTATPVVLPGHDHRRGRPRPQRTIERLLRHASIAPGLVASVTMEPQPRLAGSEGARYRRPSHLAQYPCQHLSVRWTAPLAGPLALDAGTGYGLGLLVPVSDRGGA